MRLRGGRRPPIVFFFQAEDGIRDLIVTGVQTCALPIWPSAISLSATRVLLLAHYPSDVAAGLLLGALIDRLVARLARSMRIPTAVPNHRGSACASLPMSAHGSGVPASRRGTPAMVKAAGSRAGETSSQASGVATGAPGRARVE